MIQFLIFSFFTFTLSQQTTSTEKEYKWCDIDNYGTLQWTYPDPKYGPIKTNPCVYKDGYTDEYHGFLINQNNDNPYIDVFEMRQTCCSLFSIWSDLTLNKFTVHDTRNNIEKRLIIDFTAEEYLRSHLIITIFNNATNNTWFINSNNIISKSSLILDGSRTYEEAKKYPYKIEAGTAYFNITSHKQNKEREVVYLSIFTLLEMMQL